MQLAISIEVNLIKAATDSLITILNDGNSIEDVNTSLGIIENSCEAIRTHVTSQNEFEKVENIDDYL